MARSMTETGVFEDELEVFRLAELGSFAFLSHRRRGIPAPGQRVRTF